MVRQIARRFRQQPVGVHRRGDERQDRRRRRTELRQPSDGRSGIATSPASVPPSGTQTIVTVTAMGRWRSGTYSAASAAAFGIAPPSPNPSEQAQHRQRPASTAAVETASVATPKIAMLPSSAVRRPTRSPASPADGAADHHAEKAERDDRSERACARRPKSLMMCGMAMPRSWLSMPSNTIVSAVRHDEPPLIRRPSSVVDDRSLTSIGGVRHVTRIPMRVLRGSCRSRRTHRSPRTESRRSFPPGSSWRPAN